MEELVREYGMMALYMMAGVLMTAILLSMYRDGGMIGNIVRVFMHGLTG